MAELVYAHGLGPCGSNPVEVRVLFPAPHERRDARKGIFACRNAICERFERECFRFDPFQTIFNEEKRFFRFNGEDFVCEEEVSL